MPVLQDLVPAVSLDPWTAISLWWLTALVLGLGFVLLLALIAIDPRRLDRESVWAKPAKFALSLALHFATLGAIAGWLSPAGQASPVLALAAWSSVAATIGEMAYITIQAGRARRSHFNLATPVLAALYSLMAIGAVIITMAAAVVGLLVLFDTSTLPSTAARFGAVTGLVGGTVLTLVTAFRMGAALSHHAGTEPDKARRMPLTGWSLAVGDRRVPHFFATHMMQVLPVFGFAAGAALEPPAAFALTIAAGLAYTALTLFTFAQANAGRTLLRIAGIGWRPA